MFEYRQTTDLLIKFFGKRRIVAELKPIDFSSLRASLNVGPVRLGNIISRVKSVFRWGDENDVLERPVKFGSTFKKPSKAKLREAKQARR